MPKATLVLLICLLSFAFAKSKNDRGVEKRSVVVNVGSAKVINLPFVPGDILKGDVGEADIDPATGLPLGKPGDTFFEAKWKGKKVRIRGLKVGSGNLEIFDKKGNKKMIIWVYISSPQKGRMVAALKKLLRDVEGVKVYVSGDDVTIDGELFRQKDKERIDKIIEKFTTDGVKIINLTTYSPLFMQAMAKRIEKEINDPQIHVKPLKDKFMLSGSISYRGPSPVGPARDAAAAKSARFESIAKAFVTEAKTTGENKSPHGTKIVNAIQLVWKKESQSIEKLIRVQFDFVELAKSYMKKFGFKWAPGIYAADPRDNPGMLGDNSKVTLGEDGSATSVIAGTINNLFPKLHNAKQFGHAKILESAQVITKNATSAAFQSGKSVLLQSVNDEGKATGYQKKHFGLDAKFTPEIIVETSAVSLQINIDYDSIPATGLQVSGGGAIVDHHKVYTTMIIESGKSAAIGGMIKNISYKMYDRIPQGLENSLFSIYHSKDFLHNRSQMIMFITPTIVDDATSGSKELKRKFNVK